MTESKPRRELNKIPVNQEVRKRSWAGNNKEIYLKKEEFMKVMCQLSYLLIYNYLSQVRAQLNER